MRLLLDTHTIVWAMIDNEQDRLPVQTQVSLQSGVLFYSPLSLYEIGQKARIGKWDAMLPYLDQLEKMLAERQVAAVNASPNICLMAAVLDWSHRDPFDRIIAATCLTEGLSLVSKDVTFDSLPNLKRIWSDMTQEAQ